MVKLTELYEKIDKNGNTYYVGDATGNTRFILQKKKSMGNPQGAKYSLYISEKAPRPVKNEEGNK